MNRLYFLAALPALAGLVSCGSEGGTGSGAPASGAPSGAAAAASNAAAKPSGAATAGAKAALSRADFNRLAAHLALPLFWVDDANKSGAPDADEIATLWGIEASPPDWVEDGKLTPELQKALEQIQALKASGVKEDGLSAGEKARRAAVRAELDQGRPAVVRWDFRGYSEEDKALVSHVMAAAKIVERIYARQKGVMDLAKDLAKDDAASRMLFYRNQSPFCEQPKTEKDESCGALGSKPKRLFGLYPASLQEDAKFCEKLEKDKDAKALTFQFATVTEEGGKLKAVPYNVVYKDDMAAVAAELKAAAEAVKSKEEAPLHDYLLAAAQAFIDNDWYKADEAWAKMGVNNSKWYLRIGPDETYFEPCSQKAGFQVSFARINQDSLKWQKTLEPVKKEMEETLAAMAGAPYKARDVKFKLPDFIDIVLNAGDARNATGATVGESLPNWGPVAKKGGRTVVMTNLYTDKDSLDASKQVMSSVFCKSVMDEMSMEPGLGTMSTVLHEAAHNLGPAHEYEVGGKVDGIVFGGAMAAMLEELKAQTSALYFADWLAEKGTIDKKQAAQSHYRDMAWCFGQMSQGMYDSHDKPKPYPQLASIQVGWLYKAGAMLWKADESAANGTDKGCFAADLAKLKPAVVELEKLVLGIKARGDKEGAVKLRTEFVDADGEWKKIRETVRERWLRSAKTSFVYSIEL